MPRIYVDFDGFRQISPKLKSTASKIDSIQVEFQRTVQQYHQSFARKRYS